jgi:signal transduction histidine kinase
LRSTAPCVSLVVVHFVARAKRALVEARTARDVAQEATKAKDTVLAVVAHDLRNPLQTIGMGLELVTEGAPTLDAATARRIERIKGAAERARRLVDNIVDSARSPGAGSLPIVPTKVSLSALVDEVVTPLQPIAHSRHIALGLPPTEALQGELRCDRDRLVQVLSNLVGNALRFTPSGGSVRVDVSREVSGVRFAVTDTGIGMSRDELSHAFERLWHGKGPGHGSGLGLWIVKSLVEAHGGFIDASSEPDHGTRMSFVIPQPA